MERGRDRQQQRALGPAGLGDHQRPLHRALMARNNHLRGVIVIGGLTDLQPIGAIGGLGGDRSGGLIVKAQQCRHRANTHRHGLLHRGPPDAQQPRRIGQRQRACRAIGGIFAKAVARHEIHMRKAKPFGLQRAQGSNRGGHQRRLGILRQGQGFNLPLPDQRRQAFPQGFIHLLKHRPRGGIGLCQRLAHTNGLRALSGKYECSAHGSSDLIRLWHSAAPQKAQSFRRPKGICQTAAFANRMRAGQPPQAKARTTPSLHKRCARRCLSPRKSP